MSDTQFEATFQELTGHAPLRWQSRLYRDWFATGAIPAALDLPTGLGKTSVMAVWLAARRRGALLPRRLVYVVDRRAVVDQATSVATKLAMQWKATTGKTLPISTLRGRHADNRAWLEDPAGEAIVVGTVDMVGSRLLFQGYGVSAGMRPVQAGLLGHDTLLVLDEAHLVPPFEALMRRIVDGGGLRGSVEMPVAPLQLLTLSATGRETDNAFQLTEEDREDGFVATRLAAAKTLRVVEPQGKLAEQLVALAVPLAGNGNRLAIFCHSREVSQQVLKVLPTALKPAGFTAWTGEGERTGTYRLHALVGMRRMFDRDRVAEELAEDGFLPVQAAAGSRDGLGILVATAAGEVGIDLDTDHAVMDLVPLERTIQRLGRVNRTGRAGHLAQVIIVDAAPAKEPPEEKARRAACRAVLERLPGGDASPGALRHLKAELAASAEGRALWAAAESPKPLHPPLDRPTLDAWAMTGLPDHPGRADVAPWLRGWVEEDEPEITVLWRACFPWRSGLPKLDAREVEAWLDVAPPQLPELLEAPRSLVLKVLEARLDRCGLPDDAPAALLLTRDNRLWHGASQGPSFSVGDLRTLLGDRRFRPGFERDLLRGVLVLSARLGGIDTTGLPNAEARGWQHPTATPGRGNGEPWPGCLDGKGERWTADDTQALGFRFEETAEDPVAAEKNGDWQLAGRFPLETPESAETQRYLAIFVGRTGTGGEPGDRAVARRDLLLDPHLEQVAATAGDLAQRLRLCSDTTRMLRAVALAHDLGKDRKRWQQGIGVTAQQYRDGTVLAKSARRGNPALIHPYRHEFGSLVDLLASPDDRAMRARTALEGLPEELVRLARHLIVSHHGYARPLIRPDDPDPGKSVHARDLACAVALDYAELSRQWGPWGLAWWEAVFRAADWKASSTHDQAEGA